MSDPTDTARDRDVHRPGPAPDHHADDAYDVVLSPTRVTLVPRRPVWDPAGADVAAGPSTTVATDTSAERTVAAAAPSVPARRQRSLSWLGLAPFVLYVGLFFLLPTGVVLFSAIRSTRSGGFTGANVSASLHGAYLSGLEHSITVSLVDAVVAAVLGVVLAQAIITSRHSFLPRLVSSASAVLANFGGLPLAFLFVAAIGNAGVLTTALDDHFGLSLSDDLHFDLYSVAGVEFVYLYFLVPLMVLVITPALEGLRPQWQEAAANLGASRYRYWRHVAGPVLGPSVFGAAALLFCASFSAYATAAALTNGTLSLTSLQIGAVLSGNVIAGQENVGAALALNMVVLVVPLTLVYLALQRRTTKWLQ